MRLRQPRSICFRRKGGCTGARQGSYSLRYRYVANCVICLASSAVCPAVIYCGYRFHSLFLPIFVSLFFFFHRHFVHPLFFHRQRGTEQEIAKLRKPGQTARRGITFALVPQENIYNCLRRLGPKLFLHLLRLERFTGKNNGSEKER